MGTVRISLVNCGYISGMSSKLFYLIKVKQSLLLVNFRMRILSKKTIIA